MITFDHVSKTYPNGVKGLVDINLTIPDGEYVSIIGLSGAGKTSVLRHLEDSGYQCMDNIPPLLLAPAFTLCEKVELDTPVALGVDSRSGALFDADAVCSAIDQGGDSHEISILFLEADTETLIEEALAFLQNLEAPRILDLGTGSGCIAVTLARLIPESRITAVDISEKALSIARENARRLDAKVDFRQGDALGELFPGQREQFDLIVSNPPYIPRSEKASIRVNVTGYEPAEALFVEDGDPLIFYRAIARNARRLLRPGGRLYFEIHENFADETFRMLTREGFPDTAVRRDLNDKNRMTCSLQRR